MKETAVLFGETGSLTGILSEPEPTEGDGSLPAVILLNAGLLHRIGPNRIHVKLARRLARGGVRCLRFDLSGIGDSAPRRDGLPAREGAHHEIRDAMSFVAERCGEQEFILFGICSGADYAFRLGRSDPRVVGLVLVDGYRYRTVGNYIRHYVRRLFRRRSWLNVLHGGHPIWEIVLGKKPSDPNQQPKPQIGFYRKPPRKEAEADLRAMVAGGMQICVVHSRCEAYNHREQFRHMFPSVGVSPNVHTEFLEFADHTFTLLASQEALAHCVERWILDKDWPKAR